MIVKVAKQMNKLCVEGEEKLIKDQIIEIKHYSE
jgi:hypothetical protein